MLYNRTLLVIHLRYSSVYIFIPNSWEFLESSWKILRDSVKPLWPGENENITCLQLCLQSGPFPWTTVGWRRRFLGMPWMVTVAFLLWEWWGSLFTLLSWGKSHRTVGTQTSSGLMLNSAHCFGWHFSDLWPSSTLSCWSEDAMDGSIVREFEPVPEGPVLECSVTADSKRWLALIWLWSGRWEGRAGPPTARQGPFTVFSARPNLTRPYVGLMVSIFCCENQVDLMTLKILNAKKTKCTVTEASLNVLHGASFPQSRLWTGAAARFTSDSVQAVMSQGETRAQEASLSCHLGTVGLGVHPGVHLYSHFTQMWDEPLKGDLL